MSNKRYFISAVLLIVAIIRSWTMPAPADSCVTKLLTLKDGSQRECRLYGDENYHFWKAVDGSLYLHDSISNKYFLATPTEVKHRANKVKQKQRKNKNTSFTALKGLKGEKRMLVILVEFPDVQFNAAHDITFYDKILNTDNYTDSNGFVGSVRDYFSDQSYSQLLLNFDIIGPIRVSKPSTYYGKDAADGTTDVNFYELVEEVCALADKDVDYNDYVWDNNKNVSSISIIYAGLDQATGGAEESIWGKCASLVNTILDGVQLSKIACSSELRMINDKEHVNSIGTFCHELAHGFGMQDTYDQTTGNYGTQVWDVMGTGCHKDNGFRPSGFTAFGKYFMGWITPTVLYEDAQISGMKPISESPTAYKIQNSGHENEFYLLENRQKIGWDSTLPGHGLLIMHIDYDKELFDNNIVNRTGLYNNDHERCGIILADNDTEIDYTSVTKYQNDYQGDLWPYKSNTSLTKKTRPAAILYNKNADGTYFMGKDIENIKENSDKTISFYFTNNVDKNHYGLSVRTDSVEFISESAIKVKLELINLQGQKFHNSVKSVVCKKAGSDYVEISEAKTQQVSIDANGQYGYNVEFDKLMIDTIGTEYYVQTYYNNTKSSEEWRLLSTTRINTNDLKQNYLTVSEAYDIHVKPDNSASLSVSITNHSLIPYNRNIGLYTYIKRGKSLIIQEPRDFRKKSIDAYGTEDFTFELTNLERDSVYRAYLFYYPTEVKKWKQMSGAYYIIVNEHTILSKIEDFKLDTAYDEDYCVYTINGILINKSLKISALHTLPKGIYVVINRNGDSKKVYIK